MNNPDNPAVTDEIEHTGHSISTPSGAQNTRGGSDAPQATQDYVNDTLFNIEHPSLAQMHARASAFEHYLPAEQAILNQTRAALEQKDSIQPAMQQSSWMAHVQRGAFANREADAANLPLRESIAAQYRESNFPRARVSDGAREPVAMMVRGEHGPLSFEQSQHGAEIALSGQLLGKHLNHPGRKELDAFRVDAQREPDENGKASHQTSSRHGMNLANDPGTQIRDRLQLPVMSGTSGTTSSMTLSHLHAAKQAGVEFAAPGLSREQAQTEMTDLAFHYLRKGAVPQAVGAGVNKKRQELGANPKQVPDEMVQTHSFPEVSSAVDLGLQGKKKTDTGALLQSSDMAKVRLDQQLQKAPPAAPLQQQRERAPEVKPGPKL